MAVALVDVLLAVPVQVREDHAELQVVQRGRPDPTGKGDFGKTQAALIVKDGGRLILEIGDHQIKEAIAVNVCRIGSHACPHDSVFSVSDAPLLSHITEVSMLVV